MSRRMTQMHLFSAEQEAAHPLQEAYERMEARLEKAKVEYRAMREERDLAIKDWRACLLETDRLIRELGEAQSAARHWKRMYELTAIIERLRTPASAQPAPILEPTLKKLLFVAHPDRWSQGQDASQLAHELTVVINDLRAAGQR